jgi:tRNA-dihydrouridine synthase B
MTSLFPTIGFSIGPLRLDGRVILAPLAGITDRVFRMICRQEGAALCITEMVSADGLIRNNRKTLEMINIAPDDHPLGVQLFGSDPDVLAQAARIVQDAGADLVDLNFGCPVRKVVKRGAGAAILGDLNLLRQILHQVIVSVKIPISIKIRSGIRTGHPVAQEVGRIAQGEGVHAISIHPRSMNQGFSGKADWSLIAELIANCSIPVIGSGDVFSYHDALNMVQSTGCQAVMVARGVFGNTHLIRQIHASFQNQPIPQDLSPSERLNALIRLFDLTIEEYGERIGVPRMRTAIGWYVRGMPGAATFRRIIVTLQQPKDIRKAIQGFQDQMSE